MQTKAFLSLVLTFLLSACAVTPETPVMPSPSFVTATLPPMPTLTPTITPLPPTAVPTIAPIAGTTTSEVNVRTDTSTASVSLGTIPAFSVVQVIGRDASGNWLKVIFNDGSGWVRADLVQLTQASAEIPVVGAESTAGSTNRGVIVRGVNVRSGPGTEFESLGLLSPNDVVTLFGKDSGGAWVQIGYPAASDGIGWVAAEYVQAENVDALPVVGEPAAAQTEETVAPPQVVSAINEGDTAESPLMFFDLSSVSAVQFQGEVSASDVEDWLGFTTQSPKVIIQVSCQSGSVQVELSQTQLTCGERLPFQTQAGVPYQIRITGSAHYQLKLTNEWNE